MPAYELSVLLKVLPRPELSAVLKRVGTLLLDKGAILQKIENLGTKELPYRITVNGKAFEKGSYYVFNVFANPAIFDEIRDECKRDVDILRHGVWEPYGAMPECSLDEEMKPPALRKSVQDLLAASARNKDKAKPLYKHVIQHNFYDIYM